MSSSNIVVFGAPFNWLVRDDVEKGEEEDEMSKRGRLYGKASFQYLLIA